MTTRIRAYVDERWDESIVPTLCDYIRIPNKSPMFDPEWERHGHMRDAVTLLDDELRLTTTPLPGHPGPGSHLRAMLI